MSPVTFALLLICIPICLYANKITDKKAYCLHIAKTILKHNLMNFKRLYHGDYSITYATRYIQPCFFIDIYLHKNEELIGSINYVINSDDLREKITYDNIPISELRKFKEIINLIDKDPEWA